MDLLPEQYYIAPTKYVPNSDLPVLVYRNVLPSPHDENSTSQFLEANNWEKRGTWGMIKMRHFHPNSHECYGIFQGQSILNIGVGQSDDTDGEKISVSAGDVIVLPAGTGHSSMSGTDDYRYVGVYPRGCPRWRNELGKKQIEGPAIRNEVEAVAIPDFDPVTGLGGPLPRLWHARRDEGKKLVE